MSSYTIISFRPRNVIRQLPWRVDSKAALGFLLILATFSLVGWLYLTQASAVTATSYRIDELRVELDHLKNQNASLALEIAQLEALVRVEKRARELGFEPTSNVHYVAVANYPLATEANNTLSYGDSTVQIESATAPYVAEPMPSTWWLNTLDTVAAWLAE